MNSRILILTALALLIFGSSAFAAPIFADAVVAYNPTSVASARAITDNALGAPNAHLRTSDSDIRFLSLGVGSYNPGLPSGTDYTGNGYGGSAVFTFGSGSTFTGWATIYETTYTRTGYNEFASVLGSLDNINWTFLGDINNQGADGSATVTFSGTYAFLKIVDTTALNGGVLGDGYDIDAVKVNATPIPSAAWLLGSGLIGLVGLRRRFSI